MRATFRYGAFGASGPSEARVTHAGTIRRERSHGVCPGTGRGQCPRPRCIDTEHVLLGVCHQDAKDSDPVLAPAGITTQSVRAWLAQRGGQPGGASDGSLRFTPNVWFVLYQTHVEADGRQHQSIGPAHVLLALIRCAIVAPQVLAPAAGAPQAPQEDASETRPPDTGRQPAQPAQPTRTWSRLCSATARSISGRCIPARRRVRTLTALGGAFLSSAHAPACPAAGVYGSGVPPSWSGMRLSRPWKSSWRPQPRGSSPWRPLSSRPSCSIW